MENIHEPKKTADDWMKMALEELEDASFKFACFVDHFRISLGLEPTGK